MKILVLSRNKKLHSIRRLNAEAKARKVLIHAVDPVFCQVVVGGQAPGVYFNEEPLSQYDVLLPRIGTSITDYGLTVVKQLELMGVRAVNDSVAIANSRDKIKALQILTEKKIQVPTSVMFRESRGLRLALRQVNGTPSVLKVLQGTQGVGVMLAESVNSARSVLETFWNMNKDVLMQQYISESAGRDIRAIVIGDRVVAAMRRQALGGEFRSNIHRGGEGIPIELKEPYKKVAIAAAKAMGLGIAGVDILESLSGPMVVEVNSSPGFEGIEKATGLNLAAMIIDYCCHVGAGKRRGWVFKKTPIKPKRKASKK